MSQHGVPERLSNMSKGFQEEGAGGSTMELLVETLTGTAFEMTVSPSDTILAIKSKIFRVEGIPISQQHLLHNLRELEDGCPLRSLQAAAGGARLRLVLGMRGGPVSTRRLPPPPALHDLHRGEDGEWGGGCKVVLVFRDGDKLNMLHVRDDHRAYSSSLPQLTSERTSNNNGPVGGSSGAVGGSSGAVGASGAVGGSNGAVGGSIGGSARDNAVTMGKMMDLRRRMRTTHTHGEKADIQKTRSEEILSVPSLLDEPSEPYKGYSPYNEAEDSFAPLYDGNYTRYDYECSFADRYTLLPPIGTRADSDQSVHDDELKLTDALAGSILVKGRDESLMEPLDADRELAPLTHDLGGGWRGCGRSPLAAAVLSASTSHLDHLATNRILPALSRHRNREHLHLSDDRLELSADLSTNLSGGQAAAASGRATSREVGSERRQRRLDSSLYNLHTIHDHMKQAQAVASHPLAPSAPEKEKKIRIRCGFCKKKLTISTVHKCRCGAEFCAPHRYAEVHGCLYDYKANAHQYLQRANPLVSAPKLPKI